MKMRKVLLLLLVALLTPAVWADQIDQQNIGAMPPPMGDDNYGISAIMTYRWEGQQITPTLPYMTGFDFAALAENHPWNSIPPGTVIEGRVYGNSGGMPSVLLASVSKSAPIGPSNPPASWQTFTYRFDLPAPLDITAWMYPAGITIAMTTYTPGVDREVLFSSGPNYYTGGSFLLSQDQGASWTMGDYRDMMFHTYGIVPEPITLSLLALGGMLASRRRRV